MRIVYCNGSMSASKTWEKLFLRFKFFPSEPYIIKKNHLIKLTNHWHENLNKSATHELIKLIGQWFVLKKKGNDHKDFFYVSAVRVINKTHFHEGVFLACYSKLPLTWYNLDDCRRLTSVDFLANTVL